MVHGEVRELAAHGRGQAGGVARDHAGDELVRLHILGHLGEDGGQFVIGHIVADLVQHGRSHQRVGVVLVQQLAAGVGQLADNIVLQGLDFLGLLRIVERGVLANLLGRLAVLILPGLEVGLETFQHFLAGRLLATGERHQRRRCDQNNLLHFCNTYLTLLKKSVPEPRNRLQI